MAEWNNQRSETVFIHDRLSNACAGVVLFEKYIVVC